MLATTISAVRTLCAHLLLIPFDALRQTILQTITGAVTRGPDTRGVPGGRCCCRAGFC